MVSLNSEAGENLKSKLRGTVLQPGDSGYDEARTVWNATIDRRPAMGRTTADTCCHRWRAESSGPASRPAVVRCRPVRWPGVLVVLVKRHHPLRAGRPYRWRPGR